MCAPRRPPPFPQRKHHALQVVFLGVGVHCSGGLALHAWHCDTREMLTPLTAPLLTVKCTSGARDEGLCTGLMSGLQELGLILVSQGLVNGRMPVHRTVLYFSRQKCGGTVIWHMNLLHPSDAIVVL